MTAIRLVAAIHTNKAIVNALSVRLVAGGSGEPMVGNSLAALENKDDLPALLVSYYYLNAFLKNQPRYCYRDWAMDSGAFSAMNSGKVIRLQDYIDTCKRLMESDPTLTEIFALDVIGDWRATIRNTEEMWRQGIPAIPAIHHGAPEEAVKALADYPKIAIGGVAKMKPTTRKKFIDQIFARVWPKAIHGFGINDEKNVLDYPWHSVDASSWEFGPCAFGRWKAYGMMSVRGSNQDLRPEINWYLDLEKRARNKWKRQMAELENQKEPSVRFAWCNDPGSRNAFIDTHSSGMTLRFAECGSSLERKDWLLK